jgi:hypothetical protein
MQSRILFLCLLSGSVSVISYSQTSESSLTTTEMEDSVVNKFTIRNEGGNVKPLTNSSEISGFFFFKDYPLIETYGVSLALYPGQSNSFDKMIRSFTENSPMGHTYNEKLTDYRYSNTFLYFAPGISLYSLNRKYSLDLYKRLNTQIYDNGKQFIVPLKVNFHF